ncbi:UNVERIFIED_CONTAM: hypothetical protein HDU68_012606 [Siphonaria sp. JEL0065]|nr:hypothetical protein HDU68_012606 [Siphonaria sp. JEL0065]
MTGLKVQPLKRNHALDAKYKHFKLEPHIGEEFAEDAISVQLTDILNAPNAQELIHDLAVLISERNVVFLRNQNLTFEDQNKLAELLGRAGGKPTTSGLHNHPESTAEEFGEKKWVISSERNKTRRGGGEYAGRGEFHSNGWHSDITDEWIPSDYAILKLLVAPPEGGDTLWGSGYEAYERLSPAYRELLEGLTATHQRGGFAELQKAGVVPTHSGPRGAPENTSLDYLAVHPVSRTNPVTGWKSVFANKGFTKRINELSKDESDIVLNHLLQLNVQNHDLQVRFHWNTNDIAIWDNRSAYHSATTDFDADLFERYGERSTSLGERPYFDPASTSRREALGIPPPPSRRAHLKSLGLLKESEAAKEKAPQAAPVPLRSKDSKLFNKVVSTRTSTYKIGDKVTRTETVTRTEFKPIEA